ncbi:MAG: hypothetical protein FJX84_01270 [Bacteroidetes bacterium]|nr:hypothetical protein [Bacteroidota bacterium]
MKSKVNELLKHVSKIENGSLTLPELDYSVELARELYEKLIVVRHKVYEQGILEQPTFDLSPISADDDDVIEETSISMPSTEVHKELISESEPPIFDFDNEDEGKDVPDIELVADEETTAESNENDTANEEGGELTDDQDEPENSMTDGVPLEDLSKNNVDTGTWLDRISKIESDISPEVTLAKLDTLIGSFGLNERLQFINELFGGSSEAFSDAVKVLDARTGMDSAREKIAEFATSQNWEDSDNETITDFVAKIKRRYA